MHVFLLILHDPWMSFVMVTDFGGKLKKTGSVHPENYLDTNNSVLAPTINNGLLVI